MNQITSIIIRKGTKVLCVSSKQLVELVSDVYAEASRHDDGAYGYCVGGKCYLASAGTVEVL